MRKRSRPLCLLISLAPMFSLCAGCGNWKGGRGEVRGTVQLDGRPLERDRKFSFRLMEHWALS